MAGGHPATRSLSGHGQHRDGIAEERVNSVRVANEWVDLGTYNFDRVSHVLLPLRDAMGKRGIWADAVIWLPATESTP